MDVNRSAREVQGMRQEKKAAQLFRSRCLETGVGRAASHDPDVPLVFDFTGAMPRKRVRDTLEFHRFSKVPYVLFCTLILRSSLGTS
jgi:hypothetical protein